MKRVLTVAALVILVIAGGLLGDRIDTDLPIDRPVVVPGAAGDAVPIGQGAVTIHAATAGAQIEDSWGEVLDTRGRWVLVEATLQGVVGPIDDGRWWLEDADGRRFEATDRVQWSLPEAQPGMAVRSAVVFEVAEDIELTTATIILTVGRYPQETAIRVPIEGGSGRLTLPEPELGDVS